MNKDGTELLYSVVLMNIEIVYLLKESPLRALSFVFYVSHRLQESQLCMRQIKLWGMEKRFLVR